jgi:hypothetical protein
MIPGLLRKPVPGRLREVIPVVVLRHRAALNFPALGSIADCTKTSNSHLAWRNVRIVSVRILQRTRFASAWLFFAR